MKHYPDWNPRVVYTFLLALLVLVALTLATGYPGHTVTDPRWFRP
jgi:hypothetical protein